MTVDGYPSRMQRARNLHVTSAFDARFVHTDRRVGKHATTYLNTPVSPQSRRLSFGNACGRVATHATRSVSRTTHMNITRRRQPVTAAALSFVNVDDRVRQTPVIRISVLSGSSRVPSADFRPAGIWLPVPVFVVSQSAMPSPACRRRFIDLSSPCHGRLFPAGAAGMVPGAAKKVEPMSHACRCRLHRTRTTLPITAACLRRTTR